MSHVLTVARLTIAEAGRRRLFIVLLLLTAVSVALSAWGFGRVAGFTPPHADPVTTAALRPIIYSQLLVVVTFMYSFILALGSAFIAAPMIAADIESGVVLAMLARPLRRSELLVGKWLGVAVLIGVYAVLSGIAELIVVRLTTDYTPPEPLLAVTFLVAQALVLLTLTVSLSTRLSAITGGIVALALFGLAWIGGIVGGVGVALENPDVARIGDLTRLLLPTDGLWRGTAFYLYPPAAIAAFQQAGSAAAAFPFYVTGPPSLGYDLWGILWVLGVLGLGLLSFRRREL